MLSPHRPLIARTPHFAAAVGQFMRWPAPQLPPETTAREAVEALSEFGANHAVVASGRDVCGLVCGLDLIELGADDALWWAMTPPAAVVVPSTSVETAAALLGATNSCAVIINAGDSFGVLARDDLAEFGLDQQIVCAICGTAHRVVAKRADDPMLCVECASMLVHGLSSDDLIH
jgi:hypothetical protein